MKSNPLSTVSQPQDCEIPDCPIVITERSCEVIMSTLKRLPELNNIFDIIKNSLNNCAYFTRCFKPTEWELVGEFSILFSLYPKISNEVFLRFLSIKKATSKDLAKLSSEIHASFISFQYFIVAFESSMNWFIYNCHDIKKLIKVFTPLKTACLCLKSASGKLVDVAGQFMIRMVKMPNKLTFEQLPNAEGKQQTYVTAMSSPEGEDVKLEGQPLEIKGDVENWLKEIEKRMHETVHILLNKCRTDLTKQSANLSTRLDILKGD